MIDERFIAASVGVRLHSLLHKSKAPGAASSFAERQDGHFQSSAACEDGTDAGVTQRS